MSLVDQFARDYAEPSVIHCRVDNLLKGCVRCEAKEDGWIRPWRVTQAQERALLGCRAWHPGLFWQMASCSAGISIQFETDAHHIALEVRCDQEPAGTTRVLSLVDGGDATAANLHIHDGVSCEVDGIHIPCRMPFVSTNFAPSQQPVPMVAFNLAPGEQAQLPGLGTPRRVSLNLPCLRGAEIRELLCDGTYIKPLERLGSMLVLGDSVAQGFVADDPAWNWPALLTSALGLELVNQSIGGQVFQPGFIADVPHVLEPAHIVVALGANYRFERCSAWLVQAEIRAFFSELDAFGSDVHRWCVGPVWLDEQRWPIHEHSCAKQVEQMIVNELSRREGWTYISGSQLMDADAYLLADDLCHPGPFGHEQIAERLHAIMQKSAYSDSPEVYSVS